MPALLKRVYRLVSNVVHGRKALGTITAKRPFVRLGNENAAWNVDISNLNKDSIVYSFGIGEDISYDKLLIARTGVTVHAFDPTPKSIEWLKTQDVPREFKAFQMGLGSHDGVIKVFKPADPSHVSASQIKHAFSGQETFDMPVKTLATLMAERGHRHVDLLKMDIESAEYDVIDHLVKQPGGVPITQLLIEFHHRFESVGDGKTIQALKQLEGAGFKIFSISDNYEEYSLIK